MAKMCCYLACVIVSVLVCNVWSKSVRATDNEPKRCCWPNKFSADGIATVIETNRNYSNFTEEAKRIYRFAYDGETGFIERKGKFRHFGSDRPRIKLFWEINDMQFRLSYELNEKSNSCLSSEEVFPASVCIPETAIYVGSNTTQFNNKEITTDTWMFTKTERLDLYRIYATVTRDDLCIPVSTKIIMFDDDDDDDRKIYTETLSNVVTTITDKNIVDLPDYCKIDDYE